MALYFLLQFPASFLKTTLPTNCVDVRFLFVFYFFLFSVLPSKFITANFWLTATAPLLKKRCKKTCVTVTDDFVKQFKFYTDLLAGYRDGEYGALLTPELKLSNVINNF